ncbi:MAG: hypothetical protein QM692_23185 [Thermomicrobiales bacterium]
MTQHRYLPRATMPRWREIAGALRLLALVGLCLLPMQMRAGATYVHPHALLQLLMDGGLDHHKAEGESAHAAAPVSHGDHGPHARHAEPAPPDLPTFESTLIAAGGLAMLLVSLPLLAFAGRGERIWPYLQIWRGHRFLPDYPPPRAALV